MDEDELDPVWGYGWLRALALENSRVIDGELWLFKDAVRVDMENFPEPRP